MRPSHAMIAMLPCNDLDASETFYNRLGFSRVQRDGGPLEWENDYRILTDRRGGESHLTRSVDDWLVPGRNPFTMSTRSPPPLQASSPANEGPRKSRGAPTSSRSPTPTRRWCGSAAACSPKCLELAHR